VSLILKACHCGELSLLVITYHIPTILRVSGCLHRTYPNASIGIGHILTFLTHFGVWSSGRNSTIFKVCNSPSVGNQAVCALKGTPSSKDLPRVSTLLHDTRATVPDDTFVGDVLQAVLDSNDNFYREFFVDDNHILCFRRIEDVVPRVCVPAQCKGAVCERLTVTVSWRVTQELIIQLHPSYSRDYMLTWHTLSVRVPHVQRQRVAIINGWEFHDSRLYQYNQFHDSWLYQYNHSLAGPRI